MSTDASRILRLFDGISRATDQGRTLEALRLADSARRLSPDNPTAHLVYVRALLQSGAAAEAARCLDGREDSQSLIVFADAARHAGADDDAAAACRRALARSAADSLPELKLMARQVCEEGARFPGWVGIDRQMRLVGELIGDGSAIVDWGGPASALIEVASEASDASAATGAFAVDIPAITSGTIRVRASGRDLLGSPCTWPPDFGVSGWVLIDGRELCGEVRCDWDPHQPVTLIVTAGRLEVRIEVDAAPSEPGGRPFSLRLDDQDSRNSWIEVRALLPGGASAPLIGSPVRCPQPPPSPISPLRLSAAEVSPGPSRMARINIVVPVYAGVTETLACLSSVLATTSPRLTHITVVDDASPEPELREALEALQRDGRITLIRNATNLGYPGAVNRGLRRHVYCDVVLLNADTEVFPGWLEGLRAAAYGREGIGTVTPLGEEASIVSYSRRKPQPASSAEAARIAAVAQAVNVERIVDLPVGVGFCLYVRRDCLNEIGEFEEHDFGKGYGEENDFCLRARRFGWRHVAATSVFVRHLGGRSFGAAKNLLLRRNHRLLNIRHPGYDGLVEQFLKSDPLRAAKRAIDQRLLLDCAIKPVLLMTHELPGGVRRHVDERRAALEALGHTVLALRAESAAGGSPLARIEALHFGHLLYELPADLDELRGLLTALGLAHIEIHHFLGLPAAVLELVTGLGVPYRVAIHDYVWVCPRVKLLDGANRYCGEPALAACETCVRQYGSALEEGLGVAALRQRSARVLAGAARVVAPTRDAQARLLKHFPQLRIEVEPWEAVAPRPVARRRREGRVRVLLVGAIGFAKGYAVLLECARDAAARELPLEFVLIGHSRDDGALLDTGRVFITGPYRDDELPGLLERESCDVALFASVAPETWCYALTPVLTHGVPIVALESGAVAERVRQTGTGVLLALYTPPPAINDELLRAAAGLALKDEGSYETAMESTHLGETSAAAAEPAATVQVLSLPMGLYSFTVQSGGHGAHMAANGGLHLPALHVAPAPMRSSGVIEFQCGPTTMDRWLTGPGDVVNAKISGGDAVLLLTSLRSPDSGVLSIHVSRLDAPPEELVSVPAAAPASDIRVVTLVHLPYLGDLTFVEGWAGKPADNLWIEGFSILVEAPDRPDLLQYCAVSEDGEVTPWMTDGEFCGERGTGVPLIAFALRVAPGAAGPGATPRYACRYRGRFLSGAVIGPLDDGRFCRSEAPGDPLVAMELTLEPLE